MDTRTSGGSRQAKARCRLLGAIWLSSGCIVCVACLLLAGCASPGEPVERRPPIPTAISDLAAEQSGNGVVLTCTIPKETVDRAALGVAPDFEIYRTIHPVAAASAPAASLALLVTIPSAMMAAYTTGDRFRYVDSLTAGDFLPNDQQSMASYVIRSRASPKRESADSNRVELRIFPAPLPIADLQAQANESAIALSWTPPSATLTGEAPRIAEYHIFRANAQTPSSAAATNVLITPSATATNQNSAAANGVSASPSSTAPQLTSPLVQIGTTAATQFRDPDVQQGKMYVYSVRSAVEIPGRLLESADSNLAAITLHDIFPPSAPTGLIATPVSAEQASPAHIDLSWAINPETDLAGYNVYRSGQAGVSGTRLNPELLPTPAFRDMNALPGQSYYYSVTAVDRTGNESAASAAVEAGIPTTASSPAGNQATP